MAIKCAPYHTTTEEEPEQRDVYHDYKDCPQGSRIRPRNKHEGIEGRPRCDYCIDMD